MSEHLHVVSLEHQGADLSQLTGTSVTYTGIDGKTRIFNRSAFTTWPVSGGAIEVETPLVSYHGVNVAPSVE